MSPWALVWLYALGAVITISIALTRSTWSIDVRNMFQGLLSLAVLVLLVATAVGLWQAWVPYELDFRRIDR